MEGRKTSHTRKVEQDALRDIEGFWKLELLIAPATLERFLASLISPPRITVHTQVMAWCVQSFTEVLHMALYPALIWVLISTINVRYVTLHHENQ